MNYQPIMIANDPEVPFQSLLEQALLSPIQRADLLRQPEVLGEILNSIPDRRWLFEVTRQTEDLNRAIKARSLIIEIMQYSGKLWCGGDASREDYNEALARTWIWFSEHFHEYDPTLASFVTWFNKRLGFRIYDVIAERQNRQRWENPIDFGEDDQTIDIPDPRPPWIEAEIFHNQIVDLVKRDPDNDLRNCRMRDQLHVTGQKVILAILQAQPTSPNIPWDRLVAQFEVHQDGLRNFCKYTAFPCFKRFCHRNGINLL